MICENCGAEFTPSRIGAGGNNRKYCYQCVPADLTKQERNNLYARLKRAKARKLREEQELSESASNMSDNSIKENTAKNSYKTVRQHRPNTIADITAKAQQEKLSRGCDLCGYNVYVGALEWHHPNNDREGKITPSEMLKSGKIDEYYKEIEGCMLLCSNCHRKLHEQLEFSTSLNSDEKRKNILSHYEPWQLRRKFISSDEIYDIFLAKDRNIPKVCRITGASDETIAKIVHEHGDIPRMVNQIPVRMFDASTSECLMEFQSRREAARYLGKSLTSALTLIKRACNDKSRTIYGYKWEFVDQPSIEYDTSYAGPPWLTLDEIYAMNVNFLKCVDDNSRKLFITDICNNYNGMSTVDAENMCRLNGIGDLLIRYGER